MGGYIDILVFAAIAGFIFLRLFGVLGRRTGHERPQPPLGAPAKNDDKDKVVALPKRGASEDARPAFASDDPLGAGLTQIQLADHDFDLDQFLAGARAAFEMIIDAYNKGEIEKVKAFLAEDVYRSFAAGLSERGTAADTRVTDLVAVNGCKAIEAGMRGREAFVTVRFESEQTDVVKDSEGRIVAGDPTRPAEIVDVWTFARDTRSRDPNWQLVATRSIDA